ncbi:hypothetical protein M426DRAFT_15594 [Hypoxylon sp. CI-4A]|nr:hypothetical protein M426DRAFT_15594 [Hypoxylon sp. CI-4A]
MEIVLLLQWAVPKQGTALRSLPNTLMNTAANGVEFVKKQFHGPAEHTRLETPSLSSSSLSWTADLSYASPWETRGGYHWRWEDTNGWLGFRSPVGGMYIGHDNYGKFIAQALNHSTWEYFTTRPHPDGGLLLLTKHSSGLLQMTTTMDHRLVETKETGTAWEFERVYPPIDLLDPELFEIE